MKKLLRKWTENHKMKNSYGEIEDVVVTCQEYEVHQIVVERYANGRTFGRPVYNEKEYCDTEGGGQG
jgi:hypothetical protein